MKKIYKTIFIVFVSIVLSVTISSLIINRTQKKIGVVDAIKLFNGYDMKIEMEHFAGKRLDTISKDVDSLKHLLTVLSANKTTQQSDLEQIYRNYLQSESRLEQTYAETNAQINEEVWKRLNPLIDSYAKEQNYRLIIGANGMGSVLYIGEYYDITKELIKYINDKYENGN